MKYQFRPYADFHPTPVTLTGKVYEKGEHPIYIEHRIIEVVDKEGNIHDAFEDELKSDEIEKQERSYSEEEVNEIIAEAWNSCEDNENETFTEARNRILEQFKKK